MTTIESNPNPFTLAELAAASLPEMLAWAVPIAKRLPGQTVDLGDIVEFLKPHASDFNKTPTTEKP